MCSTPHSHVHAHAHPPSAWSPTGDSSTCTTPAVPTPSAALPSHTHNTSYSPPSTLLLHLMSSSPPSPQHAEGGIEIRGTVREGGEGRVSAPQREGISGMAHGWAAGGEWGGEGARQTGSLKSVSAEVSNFKSVSPSGHSPGERSGGGGGRIVSGGRGQLEWS